MRGRDAQLPRKKEALEGPKQDGVRSFESSISKAGAAGVAALTVLGMASAPTAAAETNLSIPSEEEPELNFGFYQSNDNIPGFMRENLEDHEKRPFSEIPDDDGFTAEVRLDVTRTHGDTQWVGAAGLTMVTQQGAWVQTPEYEGLRTDLAEVAVQRNVRKDTGRLSYTYGLGAGVQGNGKLGGRGLQEWFHIHGGFGGRVGEDLQQNYTTPGYDLTPMLTGGAEMRYQLGREGGKELTARVEANLPLGRGFRSVRTEIGLAGQPLPSFPRISVETGIKYDMVKVDHDAYNFADIDGRRLGVYSKISGRITDNFYIFGRADAGGFRNEPTYTIGFQIGGGTRPWLDPLTQ